MAPQHRDQERARAAGDIEHTTMAAEIVACRERRCHSRRKRFDAGREDLLLLLGEAIEMPLSLAAAHGVFKVKPRRVADLVPEARHRPQTEAGAAAENAAATALLR
jgi:hypothetical protein